MKRTLGDTAPSEAGTLAAEIASAAAGARVSDGLAGPDFTRTAAAPLLLSVEESAAQLRIGRSRMFSLIREGKVFSVMVGGKRRIPYDSLRAYVDQLVAEQASGPVDLPAA